MFDLFSSMPKEPPPGWLVTENAFVGAFDLLGFRRLMCDPKRLVELAHKVSRLESLIRGVGSSENRFTVEGAASALRPEVIQASDTFVVYAEPEGPQDVVQFFWNLQAMAFYALQFEFPIRGAVSIGPLAASPDARLFLGPAVLDALALERLADWSGVVLSPRLTHHLRDRGVLEDLAPLIVEYAPPIKPGSEDPGLTHCLNWVADPACFLHPDFLERKFQSVPEGDWETTAVATKIANTRAFLSHVLSLGSFRPPENRDLPVHSRVFDGREVGWTLSTRKRS